MAGIPTPPPEVADKSEPKREELLDKIDSKLERYLALLDQYQALRQELGSAMSSGFISLAQANFNHPARSRYGQDQYDERMKAWRRVEVIEEGSLAWSTIVRRPLTRKKPAKTNEESEIPVEKAKGTGPPETPKADPNEHENDQSSQSPNTAPAAESPPEKQDMHSKDFEEETEEKIVDPARWFGLLVPQALRTSQGHFVRAVDEPIPRLLKVLREMRSLESEIGRTRKQVKKLG